VSAHSLTIYISGNILEFLFKNKEGEKKKAQSLYLSMYVNRSALLGFGTNLHSKVGTKKKLCLP